MRNSFPGGGGQYATYSYNVSNDPGASPYGPLYIPAYSKGGIHLVGQGPSTLLMTGPDSGHWAHLLDVGQMLRPSTATGVIKIGELAKGATQLVVTGSAPALAPGDDVWLYSGSYGGVCQDSNNTPGPQCHYSELNTVAAVNGTTITLMYPASKHYFDDGTDSFGMIKMPVTPHDIAIENMTIDTPNPILSTGLVYGVFINNVTLPVSIEPGPFGGGFKRDVTIQNSSWNFGIGAANYSGTDEYDQFTNVAFLNNTISGHGAPGAEGVGLLSRIYATEGSSQFTFEGNTVFNAGLYFDQTTDDVIKNNQFYNGIVTAGVNYGNFPAGVGGTYGWCSEATQNPTRRPT